MRSGLLTAAMLAGACLVASAAPARADVIYTFVQTSAFGGDPAAPGQPFAGVPISLTFADSAVVAGSISGQQQCTPYLGCAGLPGLLDFTDRGLGTITLGLTFLANGTLSGRGMISSSPGFSGGDSSITFQGTGLSWTAQLGPNDSPDYTYRCTSAPLTSPLACIQTGYFAASTSPGTVPEPGSFTLVGAGLLGMAWLFRGARLL